jgi:hypothetical protein
LSGNNFPRALLLAVCAMSSVSLAGVSLSKQEGDRFQHKIDEVAKNGSTVPVKPKRTAVTENELNSYLAFHAKDKIPHGLTHPQLTMLGEGRLGGRVFVDFDEFNRRRRNRSVMDPLTYLSGRVPVTARGILQTRDGKGQFQLQAADVAGLPLPKPLVQELVTFFSRSADNPKGFDLEAPFSLPAKIRELVINKGAAFVVQ